MKIKGLIITHGELGKAIINDDLDEMIDAIGDMVVVMTNLAYLLNALRPEGEAISIESCITQAWDEIKHRKGRMVNGTFIKHERNE